jgi:hypothetical protein
LLQEESEVNKTPIPSPPLVEEDIGLEEDEEEEPEEEED